MGLEDENINFYTLPTTSGSYNGQSYLYADEEGTLELVNETVNPLSREITSEDVDIIKTTSYSSSGNSSSSSSGQSSEEDEPEPEQTEEPEASPEVSPEITEPPQTELPEQSETPEELPRLRAGRSIRPSRLTR
jgi:hypothetical protein